MFFLYLLISTNNKSLDYDRLNKFLGVSDENLEKIKDFFYNISRLNIKLSKDEKTLCKSFDIDESLAKIIKSNSVSKIRPLPSVDEYGKINFDNPADGICAFYVLKNPESESELHRVIYRNKLKYLSKGYNLFYFEGNKYQEYYMALVRNKNDIDILKWRKTHGINHGIDNSKLIAKIQEWKQQYDFVLWGCGADWLWLFFVHESPQYNFRLGASNKKYFQKQKLREERTPNFKEFAKEVSEFCPDLLTQVFRSKSKLIQEMKQMNGVYLWWD